MRQYWLVKSEPEEYSWETFVKEGSAIWDGVRNFQARNNLKKMKQGDLVFYYHSGEEPQIVGIAKVLKESFPDPTTSDPQWVAVKLAPIKPLKKAVSLATIKQEKRFQSHPLLRQSRLSVVPFKKTEFDFILKLSGRGI